MEEEEEEEVEEEEEEGEEEEICKRGKAEVGREKRDRGRGRRK